MSDLALPISDELLEALTQRVAELLQPQPRMLSKSALAAHFGLAERTIKTWRSHGLPGHKIGREVMYDLREVEKWIESHS